MPERKRVVRLLALWGEVCPLTDAKEKKYERLRWLAQRVGRLVDSANDLSEEELEKCIRELQRSQESGVRSQKLKRFPNTSGITDRQLWKIWQLEHFLGWAGNPARLEGFLRAKFHESNPKFLSHAQAWRLIEMLFAIAAREEAKQRRPSASSGPVSAGELKGARAKLKRLLETWRPESAA